MRTEPLAPYRAPLRFLSAAILRIAGERACSHCHRRIIGLPYPHHETHVAFCNSNCFVAYRSR